MKEYTVRLLKKVEIAHETMAFYFEKPEGFSFIPGQFIIVHLLDPPEDDPKGNFRVFSIASAPFEDELMICTRMTKSIFKKTLNSMPEGGKVKIKGPNGSFILDQKDRRPAIFLVGGIGITPVRSIVLQTTRDGISRRISIFYSNRRPEDSAFLEELLLLEKNNPFYRIIPTMTDMEYSNLRWEGERGFIDEGMIKRYEPELMGCIFYVVGPPPMIVAMKGLLKRMGISEKLIIIEEFPGY